MVNRIAYFKHHYPHEWSRSEYLTDDKIIPYGWFCIMVRAAQANRALERLNMLGAVQLGTATATHGDNGSFEKVRDDLINEALGKLD